jgi:hypothetical protein
MDALAHPTSAHTIYCTLLTSFPVPEKKEREKRGKEKRDFFGFRERYFSFPL